MRGVYIIKFMTFGQTDFMRISVVSGNALTMIMQTSHWRSFVRKGVLRNFAKFTGKHLCVFFLIKLQVKASKFSKISTSTCFTYQKNELTYDNTEACGRIIINFSIACDSIKHDLFSVKLNAHAFDRKTLQLTHNYLTGRLQKAKTDFSHTYSIDGSLWCSKGNILESERESDTYNLFLVDNNTEVK